MFINGINFDNTLSVKRQAELVEASGLLDRVLIGNQKQLYHIGDTVEGNGWTSGVIVDVWNDNGFYYYECETRRGRKTYTHRERQQNLTLLKRG